MKPFLTLLLDSYRMLKSAAIFWVTFGISIFVAVIYLSIGFDENGITLFFGLTGIESEMHVRGSAGAEVLYTWIFTTVIVGFWLSWVAIILALISCASIFPNAMGEGSAGMLLTKGPSRLQVFAAKYLGSLLFMFVQVGLFIVIVLVAMRWQLGHWNLSLFWFLPATLLVFSFLYSFLVLVAVKTRSTLTAILLTMGLWLISWIVSAVESQMFTVLRFAELAENSTEQVEDDGSDLTSLRTWYQRSKVAYAFFPKTTPMIDAAKNALVVNGERGFKDSSMLEMMANTESKDDDEDEVQHGPPDEFMQVADDAATRHSLAYTLGTSLAFEALMLSLAAWSFCRRDF